MDDCAGKRKRCQKKSGDIRKNQDIEANLQFYPNTPACATASLVSDAEGSIRLRRSERLCKKPKVDYKAHSKGLCADGIGRPERKSTHHRLVNVTTIEQNEVPSSTTLHDLPLETLDVILEKSYLHWILYSSDKRRAEEVIGSLILVDVCFNKRITKQRFKKRILRFFKDFYLKTQKSYSIIRDNRDYLLENIQPNDEFISSLLSLNSLTEDQRLFIQRQRLQRDKNAELLYIITTFDERKLSEFVKCLRKTNQRTVARIIQNGGAVIKLEVQTLYELKTKILHQNIEYLSNKTKPRSQKTDKLISQLKEKGIEILNSHLNRLTVVVWIWCRSQAALQHLHSLYESNQLRDVLFENILLSTILPPLIVIDRSQFKKTVVERPISINFTQRIEVVGNEIVCGVTKLRKEIYVLCRSYFDAPPITRVNAPRIIRVFEDRNQFCLQRKVKIKKVKDPWDIGSCKKENCLYVIDHEGKCVWKITRETDDEYKIIKWLITDYQPLTLSVSSDGQLLVVNQSSSILMIYGPDAELIRSIQLPNDIVMLRHSVKTSIGNFIIIHDDIGGNEEQNWRTKKLQVSELTADGQIVLRRYTFSTEAQQPSYPRYLSLDSEDRVFVPDSFNRRVILLDSDLKWIRILCPTKDEPEKTRIDEPLRLCYDEEKKQLIVAGFHCINLYTLHRN